MPYRYITAEVVAVQPRYAGKAISLDLWQTMATSGVEVGADKLELGRHVVASQRRGGNSWEQAKKAAFNAIRERYEQTLDSAYYADPNNHFIVDIVYSRKG